MREGPVQSGLGKASDCFFGLFFTQTVFKADLLVLFQLNKKVYTIRTFIGIVKLNHESMKGLFLSSIVYKVD